MIVMAVTSGTNGGGASYGWMIDHNPGFTFSDGFPHPDPQSAIDAALGRCSGTETPTIIDPEIEPPPMVRVPRLRIVEEPAGNIHTFVSAMR